MGMHESRPLHYGNLASITTIGPLQARGRLQYVLRLDCFATLHLWGRQRFASHQTFLPPGVTVDNFFRQLTASLATNHYPQTQVTLSTPAPLLIPALARA